MEEKFEVHAIIELFGHTRIAGKVTEQSIGGSTFIRVDVPENAQQPAFTRMLNPSAIYAINPVTEEVATAMASRIQSKLIQVWDVEEVVKKMKALQASGVPAGNDQDEEEEENQS